MITRGAWARSVSPQRVVIVVALVALVASTGCQRADAAPTVVVGVGSTDEQRVLAALTVEALDRAGVPTELREGLGSTLGLRRRALGDQVDVYWDYTGAAWALGLREAAPPADPIESWERVREADEEQGLRWLQPTRANATLALLVRESDLPPPDAQRDLGWLAGELSSGERRLCADADFMARDGGLRALGAEYGIAIDRLPRRAATEAEAIAAVRDGRCYAGLATATSGAAAAAGLVPVEDELRVFPAFVVAPVVRAGSPADSTAVTAALAALADVLDTATLAALNARVVQGADPSAVASSFLSQVEAQRDRASASPAPR